MAILSIVLASVASLVVGSVTTVIRSYDGVTAAGVAQDTIDRLVAAPIHTWAFDANGKVKRDARAYFAGAGGYRVERTIEPVANIYELTDACDTVIGKSTDASDLVRVSVTVTPNSYKFKDQYATSVLLSRNEDALVAESSLTIKFHVNTNQQRVTYTEANHGGPIRVTINAGGPHQQTAETKKGCVTFVGIKLLNSVVTFSTPTYTESLSRTSTYREEVHLVKGGNRLVEYDLVPKRVFAVAPRLEGMSDVDCKAPRLMRMHTPIATRPNKGWRPLADIARESKQAHDALKRYNEYYHLSEEDQARLAAGNRWQYLVVCREPYSPEGLIQDPFAMVLPETIPISLVERQGTKETIKALGTWADATFNKRPYPLVEEADWPVFEIPEPKRGVQQLLLAGSCVMNGSDRKGVLVDVRHADTHWEPNKPKVLMLPMWPVPIDGVDDGDVHLTRFDHSLVRELEGTYPLVLKNVYDNGDRRRFGDSSVNGDNYNDYSKCQDTPVVQAGWLKTFTPEHDRMQLRLLMPYGLYTYAFHTADEIERNETGNAVIKSRHSCSSRCAQANGEKGCIRAGASRIRLFRGNGVTVVGPAHNEGKEFFDGYLDWRNRYLDTSAGGGGNRSLAPRGPVIEGCVAQ